MEVIIDSARSLPSALSGSSAPQDVLDTLALVDIAYISFDGKMHQGQLVVHKDLASEVRDIFAELLRFRFPIEKVVPIVAYDWDDDVSMADNNSSAFNYRKIFRTDRLSKHSHGYAIDLNPALNPQELKDGLTLPAGFLRDPSKPGTFLADSPAVHAFTSRGWDWGGNWQHKDWQHFQKVIG